MYHESQHTAMQVEIFAVLIFPKFALRFALFSKFCVLGSCPV